MRLATAGGKVRRFPKVRARRKSIAGQFVLVLVGLELLFLSSFTSLDLPTATGHNLLNFVQQEAAHLVKKLPPDCQTYVQAYCPQICTLPARAIRYDTYTPQAPVAIFLGYTCGWLIAVISTTLFLVLGLVAPFFGVYVFADGGGPDYYTQPGFGYLVGMIAAACLVGFMTQQEKRTSLRQLAALAVGIASLHIIGLAYLFGSSLIFVILDSNGGPVWLPWVFEQARNLSWYPLPYDAIFGLISIGFGFPIRSIVTLLTAPDIGLKSRADILAQQRIEEILH